MKFLKPLLFGLFFCVLNCCNSTDDDALSNDTTEHVLRLANNIGKHTVAEGCEIELYADTRGGIWYDEILNGEVKNRVKAELKLGEPISFYWIEKTSTLWRVSSSYISGTKYSESGVSGGAVSRFTGKDLASALSQVKAPDEIATLAEHHRDKMSLDHLPGLHLKNILGDKQLGKITAHCTLNTKGEFTVGYTFDNITTSWDTKLDNKEPVYLFHDSETQYLWVLSSNRVRKENTQTGSGSSAESKDTLSIETLQGLEAPAKVIELAKELKPSL